MIFPPIPLIRRKKIIKLLTKSKAFSSDTAKTFDEIGLINPNGFLRVTETLLRTGKIIKTEDGKYYLNQSI